MVIKNVNLETVCGITSTIPDNEYREVAFAGKSNVGKSSLINALMNRKALARTSSQPGKTQTINFYNINDAMYFVDLPGYGFASAPKEEKKKWGELIESYLASGRVKHIYMLLDIRHGPTEDDKMMFQYILYYAIPYTLVATKADKLARSKRRQAANACAKALGAPPYAIAYSSETGEGKEELLERMEAVITPMPAFPEDAAE